MRRGFFDPQLSDDEFKRVMEEIDAQLTAEGVGMAGRELHGMSKFSLRFPKEEFDMRSPISQKVIGWFTTRYGSRLHLPTDLGHALVLIRGDLLKFRCPLFFGRQRVFCHPETLGLKPPPLQANVPGVVNILNYGDGLTSDFVKSLTTIEKNTIMEIAVATWLNISNITDAAKHQFIKEAIADLRAAVQYMTTSPFQFGASKWSSLHAVEKFLKAYISQSGSTFEFTHDLKKLAEAATKLGLPKLNAKYIDEVQCSTSVRYDSSSVKKDEAYNAYLYATSLCGTITKNLKDREWISDIISQGKMQISGYAEPVVAVEIARFNSGDLSRRLGNLRAFAP